jgi:hypothetical protein
MVSDGIKAARVQAQHSPLINSTWPGLAFQASVLSAVRHATGWLNPPRPGRRPAGRHAAPGRPLLGRHAAPLPGGAAADWPMRLTGS